MGEEITATDFSPEDFTRFSQRLSRETALAADWVRQERFTQEGYFLGFEVEAWLLDGNALPHSINDRFLDALDDPLVVPELSRFNVELNCNPLPLDRNAFSRAETDLRRLWRSCNIVANRLDADIVMIGTLPTIRERDLTLANISPLKRYYALNNELLRQRGGRPLMIDIEGADDRLTAVHGDVMLEAATTSFQIHLMVPAPRAHHYYNASLIVAGPLVAAGANAPFAFGKSLWEETRIPLFEQAVDLEGRGGELRRVTFGSGYLGRGLMECFEENLWEYPVLLPLCFDDGAGALRHLRLHNGTIWRWVRPLLDFGHDGTPHFRIEFRVLPAGPTVIDMIANAALYTGIVHHLVSTRYDEDMALTFEDARENFYAAARSGLGARLQWPGVGTVAAPDLLLEEVLPRAASGLTRLGIDADDRERYIGVVEDRIRAGQNGAAWQRAALEARGGDFFGLVSAYCERQRGGAPVARWKP